MNLPRDDLEPITLPYWPTCQNALCWSSEDLALAAGEVVHILTPRDTSQSQVVSGHRQWHTFSLRVNLFEQSEWPFQELAPVRHFSLGEELSDSTIVSLAWSPPGLGLYRRSVLAVLTSNLILSFWESNGRLGVWQRTCIVNQHLVNRESQKSDNARRRQRIRAFHWLPSLPASTSGGWSPQILALADDDWTISIFHVRKVNHTTYGHWSFELLANHRMAEPESIVVHALRKSSLRSILSQSSPISKLDTTEWQAEGSSIDGTGRENLVVKVSRGQNCETNHLQLQLNGIGEPVAGGKSHNQFLKLSIADLRLPVDHSFPQPPPETTFNSAMQKPWSNFSEKFNLDGRIRTCYWGTTFSPDQNLAAAAISLHPADMIEYGMPSNQHTVLVFRRMREPTVSHHATQNASAVHERVLQFVAESPTEWVRTVLDKNIVRNAAALVTLEFQNSWALANWAAAVSDQLSKINAQGQGTNAAGESIQPSVRQDDQMELDQAAASEFEDNPVLAGSTQETCEICAASIPFTSPITSAKCVKGHQLTRCSLSFVAIQEPGISKYCARCGRQFLDPGKTGFSDGPSLSQKLFDKFDVCPYCQGKFRG